MFAKWPRGLNLTNGYPDDSLLYGITCWGMKIKIKLNHMFQPFAGGHETVEVTGGTVKECLDNFMELFPVFKQLLFDDEGNLSALVLYNGETIVPYEINRPVSAQNEILILPMVQGG